MPYDILPFVIIIISFLGIIIIIGRKIPELRVIDVDTIVEEKEQQVKKTLLTNRLKRNLENIKIIIAKLFKPFLKNILYAVRNFYNNIIDLENQYRDKAKREQEKELLPSEQVKQHVREGNLKIQAGVSSQEAEESFIRAIEIDNKNTEAYKGLVEVYLKYKDLKKAKEVCRYLLKLYTAEFKQEGSIEKKHTLAACHADLGDIEKNLDNLSGALRHYRTALRLVPNNPKFLDLLLKISIILKDKKLAENTLKQLKVADPENQKVGEFEETVKSLQ